MAELNIPKEHQSKFLYFINLDAQIKNKIFKSLSTSSVGLTHKQLVEHIHTNVKDIEKDKILDIITIYSNLIKAKDSFGISLQDFISKLEQALIDTGDSKLHPNKLILADFENLLSSGKTYANTAKVLDLMTENERTFLDAKIYQDIRPNFDERGKIIGSAIIHSLKLIVRENKVNKEIYLALDNNDINKLVEKLKIAQENIKYITENFANANFIEL